MSVWRRNGYRKSIKKSDISKPLHFEHRIHADFDPLTGDIIGLPLVILDFLIKKLLFLAMASLFRK